MANQARVALSKVDGVDSVIVDTTARAVFRIKDGGKPSEKALNAALNGTPMKVSKLKKRKLPLAVAKFQITIDGLS